MSEGQQQAQALAKQVALAQQDALENARITSILATPTPMKEQIASGSISTPIQTNVVNTAPIKEQIASGSIPKPLIIDAPMKERIASGSIPKPVIPTVPTIVKTASLDVDVITPTNYKNPTVIEHNVPSIDNQILTVDYRIGVQSKNMVLAKQDIGKLNNTIFNQRIELNKALITLSEINEYYKNPEKYNWSSTPGGFAAFKEYYEKLSKYTTDAKANIDKMNESITNLNTYISDSSEKISKMSDTKSVLQGFKTAGSKEYIANPVADMTWTYKYKNSTGKEITKTFKSEAEANQWIKDNIPYTVTYTKPDGTTYDVSFKDRDQAHRYQEAITEPAIKQEAILHPTNPTSFSGKLWQMAEKSPEYAESDILQSALNFLYGPLSSVTGKGLKGEYNPKGVMQYAALLAGTVENVLSFGIADMGTGRVNWSKVDDPKLGLSTDKQWVAAGTLLPLEFIADYYTGKGAGAVIGLGISSISAGAKAITNIGLAQRIVQGAKNLLGVSEISAMQNLGTLAKVANSNPKFLQALFLAPAVGGEAIKLGSMYAQGTEPWKISAQLALDISTFKGFVSGAKLADTIAKDFPLKRINIEGQVGVGSAKVKGTILKIGDEFKPINVVVTRTAPAEIYDAEGILQSDGALFTTKDRFGLFGKKMPSLSGFKPTNVPQITGETISLETGIQPVGTANLASASKGNFPVAIPSAYDVLLSGKVPLVDENGVRVILTGKNDIAKFINAPEIKLRLITGTGIIQPTVSTTSNIDFSVIDPEVNDILTSIRNGSLLKIEPKALGGSVSERNFPVAVKNEFESIPVTVPLTKDGKILTPSDIDKLIKDNPDLEAGLRYITEPQFKLRLTTETITVEPATTNINKVGIEGVIDKTYTPILTTIQGNSKVTAKVANALLVNELENGAILPDYDDLVKNNIVEKNKKIVENLDIERAKDFVYEHNGMFASEAQLAKITKITGPSELISSRPITGFELVFSGPISSKPLIPERLENPEDDVTNFLTTLKIIPKIIPSIDFVYNDVPIVPLHTLESANISLKNSDIKTKIPAQTKVEKAYVDLMKEEGKDYLRLRISPGEYEVVQSITFETDIQEPETKKFVKESTKLSFIEDDTVDVFDKNIDPYDFSINPNSKKQISAFKQINDDTKIRSVGSIDKALGITTESGKGVITIESGNVSVSVISESPQIMESPPTAESPQTSESKQAIYPTSDRGAIPNPYYQPETYGEASVIIYDNAILTEKLTSLGVSQTDAVLANVAVSTGNMSYFKTMDIKYGIDTSNFVNSIMGMGNVNLSKISPDIKSIELLTPLTLSGSLSKNIIDSITKAPPIVDLTKIQITENLPIEETIMKMDQLSEQLPVVIQETIQEVIQKPIDPVPEEPVPYEPVPPIIKLPEEPKNITDRDYADKPTSIKMFKVIYTFKKDKKEITVKSRTFREALGKTWSKRGTPEIPKKVSITKIIDKK